LVGKRFDSELTGTSANGDDIDLTGVTTVTSQGRNGTVKLSTTFVDDNGFAIGTIKTTGKVVKGSVNSDDGTETIVGTTTGKLNVGGLVKVGSAKTTILVEDAGDTLTFNFSSKKLAKLGVSDLAMDASAQ